MPELRPQEPVKPGYAWLTLKGWEGSTEGVSVSILRNQDNRFLDSNGQWVNNEVFLTLPSLVAGPQSMETLVGPSMVDPLLANRQAAYRLTLSDSASRDPGILKVLDGVLTSLAGGDYRSPDNTQALQDAPSPPVKEEAEPETVAEPKAHLRQAAEAAPASGGKSKKSLIFGIITLLIIIAAAAAWWFLRPQAAEKSPAAAPAAAAPAQTEGPCGIALMKQGSELDFVKGCLRSQPSSVQVMGVINEAKAEKRCDIAQRLYAYKAQSGDTQIALQYAREYDPETAAKEGCFVADAQTALYWYETIASQDPQNTEAKARLAALKKQDAQ